MIAVYTLDGTELLLNNGSTFTINLVSTAFNDTEEFLGSYSYPVELAYCAQNNKALGMANRLENRSARKDIEVLVGIFGSEWKRCLLSFTLAENGYSAFLKIDNGAFGNLIKNKLLTDVFVKNNLDGTFKEFVWLQLSYSANDTLAYLSNSQATPGKYPAYFFPLKNPALFGSYSGGGNPPYNDDLQTVNPWAHGQGYHTAVDAYGTNHCFYTPFLSLTWAIQQVLAFLGYSGQGDFFIDPKIMDKVIYNNGFFGQSVFMATTGLKIAPARHLPPISIGEFFKKLRTNFKLKFDFDPNTKICTIKYLRSVLASRDRLDIGGRISPRMLIKSDLPKGYRFVQPVDGGDNTFKNFTYYKDVHIGDPTAPKDVDGFIGTLFTRSTKNPLNANYSYRVPVAEQRGNGYTTAAAGSEAYNLTGYNKNTFDFRLLTYRGMQNDDQGAPYPYATGDEFDSDGAGNSYGMSLWVGGKTGVLQQFSYDFYVFFLRAELVELTAFIPFKILENITKTDQLIFNLPTQAEMPALFNDISFEASQNQLLLQAKLRVYPIYSQQDMPLPSLSQFTPGEQINPGDIYVRFRLVYDQSRDNVRMIGSQVTYKDRYADIHLDFFSDAAGTKPRAVNNLTVIMHSKYESELAKYYAEWDFPVYASGTTYQVGLSDPDDHVYHTGNFGRFEIRTYTIVKDPAVLKGYNYKVIN